MGKSHRDLTIYTIAKALDKHLSEKDPVIGEETPHNPSVNIGLKNLHCDFLSHIHIDYTRDQLKMDVEYISLMRSDRGKSGMIYTPIAEYMIF
ncbi:MAG: hypothetical protein K6G27_15000 [Lachnospiraceae bacterium]|nr:hypothetical protein [Lachnospiraceae bacterium]